MNLRSIAPLFFPRHWILWILGNTALLIAVFVSLEPNGDPHSEDPEVFNRGGNHATWMTVILIGALVCLFVGGFRHCSRKTKEAATRGRFHALEGSVAGSLLGIYPPSNDNVVTKDYVDQQDIADAQATSRYTEAPPQAPWAAPILFVKGGLVPGKPIMHAEEHDDFTIVDRRSSTGMLDD